MAASASSSGQAGVEIAAVETHGAQPLSSRGRQDASHSPRWAPGGRWSGLGAEPLETRCGCVSAGSRGRGRAHACAISSSAWRRPMGCQRPGRSSSPAGVPRPGRGLRVLPSRQRRASAVPRAAGRRAVIGRPRSPSRAAPARYPLRDSHSRVGCRPARRLPNGGSVRTVSLHGAIGDEKSRCWIVGQRDFLNTALRWRRVLVDDALHLENDCRRHSPPDVAIPTPDSANDCPALSTPNLDHSLTRITSVPITGSRLRCRRWLTGPPG